MCLSLCSFECLQLLEESQARARCSVSTCFCLVCTLGLRPPARTECPNSPNPIPSPWEHRSAASPHCPWSWLGSEALGPGASI